MREILFRGKTKQGEWVYGLPFYTNEIIDGIESKDGKLYYVIPETVGQFTGLTDKNGKKVFEGDIVQQEITWRENQPQTWIVEYEYGGFIPFAEDPEQTDFMWDRPFEVIGNIHDNPELLEV